MVRAAAVYTLALHDALPISAPCIAVCGEDCPESERRCAGTGLRRLRRRLPARRLAGCRSGEPGAWWGHPALRPRGQRSEEHTSELQSRGHLVCRLLLEKKMR